MVFIPAIGNDGIKNFEVQVTLFKTNSPKVIVTGLVDDVIIESSSIAITLLKSFKYDLDSQRIHIHYCDYSFSKEGSSAMLGTYIALFLAINNFSIGRKILVTGEIDIKGNIYGVGGVLEKYKNYCDCGFDMFIIPKEGNNQLIKKSNNVFGFNTIEDVNDFIRSMFL